MEPNLLDRMLSGYVQDQTPVVLTLQNKTRVHGKIKAFDSYVIIMDGQKHGIIYRHAISCVSPFVRQEVRQPAAQKAPPSTQTRPPERTSRPAPQAPRKNRPERPAQRPPAATAEPGLNNNMKEGLMMWMQKQKVSK